MIDTLLLNDFVTLLLCYFAVYLLSNIFLKVYNC